MGAIRLKSVNLANPVRFYSGNSADSSSVFIDGELLETDPHDGGYHLELGNRDQVRIWARLKNGKLNYIGMVSLAACSSVVEAHPPTPEITRPKPEDKKQEDKSR